MIQIPLGSDTRRLNCQTGCSRNIYIVKLGLSLHSTLSHQEVSAFNGLYFSPLKSMGWLCPFLLWSPHINVSPLKPVVVLF